MAEVHINVEGGDDVHLSVDGASVHVGCDCCEGDVCSATAGMPDLSHSFMASEYRGDTESFSLAAGQCQEDDKMLVTPGNQTEAQIRLLQELEEHLRTLVEEDDTSVAADHIPHECPSCGGDISWEWSGRVGEPVEYSYSCNWCPWSDSGRLSDC